MTQTVKCPICKHPYKIYAFSAADQSACPECVWKSENVSQRKKLPCPQIVPNDPANADDAKSATVLQQIMEYQWDSIFNTPEAISRRETLYRFLFESGKA